LDLLEQARGRWPPSTMIRYRLAAAQARNGGAAQAVQNLRELLAANAAFAERKDAEALLAKLTGR
jgi:hypothetical protein